MRRAQLKTKTQELIHQTQIVKQNAINTATQNKQNPNGKPESDTPDKRKLSVTIKLADSKVKDIKGWKMSSCTRKVVVKHFSGAKTKDMKSYIIPTVDQKPDNIALNTRINDLKTMHTPDEITLGILNLAMNDTNGYKQRFYIWYCAKI